MSPECFVSCHSRELCVCQFSLPHRWVRGRKSLSKGIRQTMLACLAIPPSQSQNIWSKPFARIWCTIAHWRHNGLLCSAFLHENYSHVSTLKVALCEVVFVCVCVFFFRLLWLLVVNQTFSWLSLFLISTCIYKGSFSFCPLKQFHLENLEIEK